MSDLDVLLEGTDPEHEDRFSQVDMSKVCRGTPEAS